MADQEQFSPPFVDPYLTAKGERRASVDWRGLKTLWFNTGTLCNIQCTNCYIESSPKNDRLVYLTLADITPFLDEIDALGQGPVEIGVTGGEPFMCPEILAILEACLLRGHTLMVLTNAMQPMMRPRIRDGLLDLNERFGDRMTLRVSMDHHSIELHDAERGSGSYRHAIKGLSWLADHGFKTAIAGRRILAEDETTSRASYGSMIARIGLNIDPQNERELVLFPEMTASEMPPEISVSCWSILNVDPADMMCASQRMVVRKKGTATATVMPCTLLAYDTAFEMGTTLADATDTPVHLTHRWCAEFCVLGGGSCSA
ncbi:MAG: radical SAM protein [Pseudomonadota bacterium]